MNHHCDFHPLASADWQCATCGGRFCALCRAQERQVGHGDACPECAGRLEALSSGSSEQPLWSERARVIKWSLSRSTIMLTLMMAILALGWQWYSVENQAIPLWFLASMIAVVSVLGLCMVDVLQRQTEKPKARPDLVKLLSVFRLTRHAVLAASVSAVLVLQTLFWHNASPVLSLTIVALGIALAPVLLTYSLMSGARPNFLQQLGRLKLGYFANVVFAVLLFGLVAVSLNALALHSLPVVAVPASVVLICAALFLYFTHLALVACEAGREHWRKAKHVSQTRQSSIDIQLDKALKQGRYDLVIDQLEQELFKLDSSDLRLEQLHQTMLWSRDWHNLARYSQSIIHLYLAKGREHDAVELVKVLKKELGQFRVQDIKQTLRLAKACDHENEYGVLLWLAQNAHERFKDSQLVVSELYLLVSRVLRQNLDDPERASRFQRYAQDCIERHKAEHHPIKSGKTKNYKAEHLK